VTSWDRIAIVLVLIYDYVDVHVRAYGEAGSCSVNVFVHAVRVFGCAGGGGWRRRGAGRWRALHHPDHTDQRCQLYHEHDVNIYKRWE